MSFCAGRMSASGDLNCPQWVELSRLREVETGHDVSFGRGVVRTLGRLLCLQEGRMN